MFILSAVEPLHSRFSDINMDEATVMKFEAPSRGKQCTLEKMDISERERLRQSFQPSRVQLLFVGESPPASGRFFYSANSGLYRAMRAAFKQTDPRIRDDNFLAFFRGYACYLIDLSLDPVDHLDARARRAMCNAGEEHLTDEIKRLQPGIIAPVLRSIANNVEHAAARAKWKGRLLPLPYPGRWSRLREAFIDTLQPVLRQLRFEDGCELNPEAYGSGEVFDRTHHISQTVTDMGPHS